MKNPSEHVLAMFNEILYLNEDENLFNLIHINKMLVDLVAHLKETKLLTYKFYNLKCIIIFLLYMCCGDF